jgi:hypothetical protein
MDLRSHCKQFKIMNFLRSEIDYLGGVHGDLCF